MRRRSAGAMPGPSSSTRISTQRPSLPERERASRPPRPPAPGGPPPGAGGGGGVQRVQCQVEHDLPERVAGHRDLRGVRLHGPLEPHAAFAGAVVEQPGDALEGLADARRAVCLVAVVRSRVLEHRVEQPFEPGHLVDHDLPEVLEKLAVVEAARQQLQERLHRDEWIADLVDDLGDQLTECGAAVEALHGLVEPGHSRHRQLGGEGAAQPARHVLEHGQRARAYAARRVVGPAEGQHHGRRLGDVGLGGGHGDRGRELGAVGEATDCRVDPRGAEVAGLPAPAKRRQDAGCGHAGLARRRPACRGDQRGLAVASQPRADPRRRGAPGQVAHRRGQHALQVGVCVGVGLGRRLGGSGEDRVDQRGHRAPRRRPARPAGSSSLTPRHAPVATPRGSPLSTRSWPWPWPWPWPGRRGGGAWRAGPSTGWRDQKMSSRSARRASVTDSRWPTVRSGSVPSMKAWK